MQNCIFDSFITTEKDFQRFPVKLWRIIEECTTDAIGWGDDGATIKINRPLFECQYMRGRNSIFQTETFTSLIRQMNMYGFKKVQRSAHVDRNILEYEHPYFKRHFKDFSKLQRRGSRGQEQRNTDEAFERVLQLNGNKWDTFSYLTHTAITPLPKVLEDENQRAVRGLTMGLSDQDPGHTNCLCEHREKTKNMYKAANTEGYGFLLTDDPPQTKQSCTASCEGSGFLHSSLNTADFLSEDATLSSAMLHNDRMLSETFPVNQLRGLLDSEGIPEQQLLYDQSFTSVNPETFIPTEVTPDINFEGDIHSNNPTLKRKHLSKRTTVKVKQRKRKCPKPSQNMHRDALSDMTLVNNSLYMPRPGLYEAEGPDNHGDRIVPTESGDCYVIVPVSLPNMQGMTPVNLKLF